MYSRRILLTKKKITIIFLSLILVLLLSNCSDDNTPKKNDKDVVPPSMPISTPSTETPEPEEEPEEIIPLYDVPECITKAELIELKKKNPDFRFWFYLPSETVKSFNYPVMQTEKENKNFYIDKDFDKNDDKSGTLFLFYLNDGLTLNGHSTIFGHNNSDGSMFGNILRYYQDDKGKPLKNPDDCKFIKDHPYFYTYTENETSVWKVFSVYDTVDTDNYLRPVAISEPGYYDSIKILQEKSYFDIDVDLKADDDVITLSTCYRFNHKDGRLVVHAVRIQTTPTK